MEIKNFSNRIKLYLKIVENSFTSLNAYKINTISKIIYSILLFSIQAYIWKAYYAFRNIDEASMITFTDMITYVFISSCISAFVNFEASVTPKIGEKIISGNISTDLIKPLSIAYYYLCEYIGNTLYRIIFNLLPLFILVRLIFKISIHASPINVFLFLISIINSNLLYFLFSYTIGLLSFWYNTVGNLNILVDSSITLLSGAVIPLWFVPREFLIILDHLPFKLIYFSPISIMLNKLSLSSSLGVIKQQVIWIIIFVIISKLVYLSGIKRVEIQGG